MNYPMIIAGLAIFVVLFTLNIKEGFDKIVNPITICNNNCEKCKSNPGDKEACDACASCKK